MTDEYLSKRIQELSEAKETKFFQKDGIVTDQRDVEALGIQADMIQFSAKLKGHLIDKLDISGNLQLGDRLKAARERLKKC